MQTFAAATLWLRLHLSPIYSAPKRVVLMLALCIPLGSAWAFISSPPGSYFELNGGYIDLAGTDLVVEGVLILSNGAHITGIRNLVIANGGELDITGATITLSQDYSNQGEVTNQGGGSVTRVDGGPSNPAKGPLGTIDPFAGNTPHTQTATPVPGLNGTLLIVLSLLMAWLVWTRPNLSLLAHIPNART
ncbi:hypothetical protein E9531_10900 [Lampropedia puyangensis]|uniref:IPTL-CTERM sorting domain-containing protein n=1 Tax=Lampropedia puyangensis TaxID=1330072 RepID=A0A4S8F062_9BURK|nr:hypothetical protein [Lampropedia puyangensis]THU00267.1 hypothetical protein E9531_10900 [Lampropedia puyangensis]